MFRNPFHKGSFRYQLKNFRKPLILFYSVILALYLLMAAGIGILTYRYGGVELTGGGAFSGGMEVATMIFLFVCGICSFREELRFLIQNGCSRATVFTGWLVTAVSVSAIAAGADTFIYGILRILGQAADGTRCLSAFELQFLKEMYTAAWPASVAGTFAYNFLMDLAALSIGYLITVAYYRMNKGGCVAVSVGVPVTLMFVLPILSEVFPRAYAAVANVLGQVMQFCFGSIGMHFVSLLVISALLAALSWWMIRRAPVKVPQK